MINCVLFLLLLTIACGCSEQPDEEKNLLIRDFRLESLKRDRFYLNDHRGHTTLLVFWATTCPQCKHELRDLHTIIQERTKETLTIAAICVDPENISSITPFLAELNPSVEILLDHQGELFQELQLSSLPSTILISPNGEKAMQFAGYSRLLYKQLAAKIQMLEVSS